MKKTEVSRLMKCLVNISEDTSIPKNASKEEVKLLYFKRQSARGYLAELKEAISLLEAYKGYKKIVLNTQFNPNADTISLEFSGNYCQVISTSTFPSKGKTIWLVVTDPALL